MNRIRTLIEYDLAARKTEATRAAVTAWEHPAEVGIALAGMDQTLLSPENSQVWREVVEPLTNRIKEPVKAWRVESLAGGCLVQPDTTQTKLAIARLGELIETAGRNRVSHLTISAAKVGGAASVFYADALNATYQAIVQLIPLLERSEVVLCLRAAHAGFLMSPPELRDLLDRFESPFVAADVEVSSPESGFANAGDWLETLGPRVGIIATEDIAGLDTERGSCAGLQEGIKARCSNALLLWRMPAK